MVKCCSMECGDDATCAVRLRIPAVGHAIDSHDPLKVIFGMPLCDAHYGSLDPRAFVGPELEKVVEIMCRGKAAPDFDRVYKEKVLLDSEEYNIYLSAAAKPVAGDDAG